ncbi:hypothetical protein KKF70_00005, partial [bacterium]|nr:hypothetical protein [bacterium]
MKKQNLIKTLLKRIGTVPILSLLLFSVPVFAANLLPNTVDNRWHYGFESDALLADDLCWEENGGGATNNTLIDGNEVNVRGTRSCKFDNPTTAYTGRYVLSSTVTVTAGTGYYVGAWAYVSLVAGVISETQIQLGIRWYDASDVLLSSEPVSGDLTLSTFTVWNKLIFSTITAPATATQARFLISGKETGGNDNDIYIDDAEFIEAVVADNIPPCGISNLTALMGDADGKVNLVWTAPGDDGTSGDITSGSLTIYAATYTLTDTAALSAVSQSPYTLYKIVKSTAYTTEWSEHSYTMTGLYPGTTYYFAVTVTDDASNTSVWNYGAFNTKSTAPACDLKPDIV